MKIQKHAADQMTPLERRRAVREGRDYDRVPCIPFMGEFKCRLTGTSVWDFWHDPQKMAEVEIAAFNRYGYDRIVIGPNTRGITEALGGRFIYPERGLPYADEPLLGDARGEDGMEASAGYGLLDGMEASAGYGLLDGMEAVDAGRHERIRTFRREAELLADEAKDIVPIEISIGGPFTIASNLRGVERLLRDLRKCPEKVQRLLRLITDSQKSCIDMAAEYGFGVAMADPVANPALIGPKMYERFVYPYTKELTDYALERTGERVSLHMCGRTCGIWEYLCRYELNELSLDNIIDLERAVRELGDLVPIAGNVDPVEIVMNGSREEIFEAVRYCIETGRKAKKGYVLASGCDIPDTTEPVRIDWLMEAARTYRK